MALSKKRELAAMMAGAAMTFSPLTGNALAQDPNIEVTPSSYTTIDSAGSSPSQVSNLAKDEALKNNGYGIIINFSDEETALRAVEYANAFIEAFEQRGAQNVVAYFYRTEDSNVNIIMTNGYESFGPHNAENAAGRVSELINSKSRNQQLAFNYE